MHAHETIHVWKISHVHKSLHGEVHRLITACYKKNVKNVSYAKAQTSLYLNVNVFG